MNERMSPVEKPWLWYLGLTVLIYVINCLFFDFWSDDFGYFLSFNTFSKGQTGLFQMLGSYLTGGVPRLQIGWHLTHQLLFLVFGTWVTGYFLVQAGVLAINSILLEKVLRPFVGGFVSFWSGVLLLVSPFYRESFYWVSANYGFFQVLFFLLALLCAEVAVRHMAWRRWLAVFCAAVCVVLSCLYQEQAITYAAACPLVFGLLYCKLYSRREVIRCAVGVFVLACTLFVALYLPQLSVIKSSGSTSLVDSLHQYYPTPLQSIVPNFTGIFRWSILGALPKFLDFGFLWANFGQMSLLYKGFWLFTICTAFLIFAGLVRKGVRLPSPRTDASIYTWCALFIWWVSSFVVVLPLVEFLSRYVYIVLPAAIPMVLLVLVKVIRKGAVYLTPALAMLCVVDMSAFYYGSFFPLIDLERKTYTATVDFVRSNPQTKALVFENFPVRFNDAVSGVWINYHATDWWYKWKSLPNPTRIEIVGNAVNPGFDPSGSRSGFRLTFAPYPLDRMAKLYSPKEVGFVKFSGSAYAPEPNLKFYQKKPFRRSLIRDSVTIASADQSFDIPLPKGLEDLSGCYLDVVAEVQSSRRAAAVHLYKATGSYVDGSSTFSTGIPGVPEKIFFRTLIREAGPYFLRLTNQPVPLDDNSVTPTDTITFKSLQVLGCGNQHIATEFMASHNPDPAFAFNRWVSPQSHFSVVLPFAKSDMWETQFGVGVNDVMNRGDFYCYPDDTVTVKTPDGKTQQAYVGMLGWKRSIRNAKSTFSVEFSRKHGDPLTKRSPNDRMSNEEFVAYPKDDVPLDMTVRHSFDLNKNYSEVRVSLKSVSTQPLSLRWVFQDSSVFDFPVGSDRGVGTVGLGNDVRDRMYISTRIPGEDNPIPFRVMYPNRYNLAVMENSFSPYLGGYFLGGSYMANKENIDFKSMNPGELQIGESFPMDQSPPHRTHGLWFDLTLAPGEEKVIDYQKIFLANWYDIKELRESAKATVDRIRSHATSRASKVKGEKPHA